MDKENLVYLSNEYYSAVKRDELLIHATTWINIMLSERSQTQKTTHCMIPFK